MIVQLFGFGFTGFILFLLFNFFFPFSYVLGYLVSTYTGEWHMVTCLFLLVVNCSFVHVFQQVKLKPAAASRSMLSNWRGKVFWETWETVTVLLNEQMKQMKQSEGGVGKQVI